MSKIFDFDEKNFIATLSNSGKLSPIEIATANQELTLNRYSSVKEMILAKQLLADNELSSALADYVSGCCIGNLDDVRLSTIIEKIDKEEALKARVLPIRYKGKEGYLVTDPFSKGLEEQVCKWLDYLNDFILFIGTDFQFDRIVKLNNATFDNTQKKSEDEIEILLESTIENAIEQRASDIRVFHTKSGGQITFRIDGDIYVYRELDEDATQRLCKLIEDERYTKVNDTNKKVPRVGKMKVKVKGKLGESTGKVAHLTRESNPTVSNDKTYELRINLIPAKSGMDCNLRFMFSENFEISNLGATKPREQLLKETVEGVDNGLILLTGTTGSGKSSTVYSLLGELLSKYTVCTIEDPVEHEMPGILQLEIANGITYDKGVESFLRHDPDVIFIGETRSPEVCRSLFRAASTGHLTISSMHTNTTTSTIGRIRDLGISNSDIADYLKLVISQRLIKRSCRNCQEVEEIQLRQVLTELGIMQPSTLREILGHYNWEDNLDKKFKVVTRNVGCSQCSERGTQGRCLITEMLQINYEMKEAILQNEPAFDLRQIAGGQIFSFEEAIVLHLLDGTISLQEAKMKIREVQQ